MTDRTTADVLDALNALYESEQDSIFRVMGNGSPYLTAAPAHVRQSLEEIRADTERQGGDLVSLIKRSGGEPARGHPPRAKDDALLGFLSLRFLLPKLADEKALCIRRYDNALRAIGRTAPPGVSDALRSLQAENTSHRELLTRLAEEAIAASR